MKALPDVRKRKRGEVIRPQGKIGEADGVTGAGALHREIASRRHGARPPVSRFLWAVRGEYYRDRSGANESRRTGFGADLRG